MEVVAPISAPMLQMVPIPVALMDSTPGPKYSTMAPVPPFTVNKPATFYTERGEKKGGVNRNCLLKPIMNHYLEDDILGSRPASNLARQLHSNVLGRLELPRQACHDVHSVGSSDSNCDHAEASSVDSVRVSSNHESSGKGVVFNDNLVNDSRSGSPKADAVLLASSAEKLIDLLVGLVGAGEVFLCSVFCHDEMVAVNGGGNGSGGQSGRHKLQHRHLRSRVLHRHAVGQQTQIRRAPLDVLTLKETKNKNKKKKKKMKKKKKKKKKKTVFSFSFSLIMESVCCFHVREGGNTLGSSSLP